MPRFAANLTTMYPEIPLDARFAAARAAGFEAVELLFPYSHRAPDIKRWLAASGLQLILVNTPLGDGAAGERGLGALPDRAVDFRAAFDTALDYATTLGAGMIHVMAGVVPAGVPAATCEEVLIERLQTVAPIAAREGVRLLLEPLNDEDTPGYLYSTSDHALRLIDAVGDDNVALQYDFYHLQITQGNLLKRLSQCLGQVGHVQFSSVPGRHEPQHGEVNLPYLFGALDDMGYDGWVGCEYRPLTTTAEGLAWAQPWGLG